MGQSLGCYLAGISSRFVWLSSFCYYACCVGQSLGPTWLALSLVSLLLMLDGFLALLFLCWLRRSIIGLLLGWQFLSPNYAIDCDLSNLYQTFNVTVQTRAAVSLASRLVLTIFFLLFHSFACVQQYFRFPAFTRALLLFVGLQPQLCGLWRIFVAPFFIQ